MPLTPRDPSPWSRPPTSSLHSGSSSRLLMPQHWPRWCWPLAALTLTSGTLLTLTSKGNTGGLSLTSNTVTNTLSWVTWADGGRSVFDPRVPPRRQAGGGPAHPRCWGTATDTALLQQGSRTGAKVVCTAPKAARAPKSRDPGAGCSRIPHEGNSTLQTCTSQAKERGGPGAGARRQGVISQRRRSPSPGRL